MPRWCRLLYGVWMVTLTTLYFALPDAPRYLWTVIGCSSVLAIVIGTLVNRPRQQLAWWLVAAGTLTFIGGDTAYDVLVSRLGAAPFPSVADVLYLCTYPFLAWGLLLVLRARSRDHDRDALLDALVVMISLGLLTWVFLVAPYVQDRSLSTLEKTFSIAYPLGDVLLLAVLARLLIGQDGTSWPVRFLTVGTSGLLVSDVLYGLIQLNGTWATGGPVDVGWIVFYAAWGAAALHPDMTLLAESARPSQLMLSGRRLLLLGSFSLMPPLLLLWEALAGDASDLTVIALASGALFVLVTMRLSRLVVVARLSTHRESILRGSGEALAGAAGREEIYAVTARAVAEITQGVDEHRVLITAGPASCPRLAYDSAGPVDDSSVGRLQALIASHSARLRDQHVLLVPAEVAESLPGTSTGVHVPVLMVALQRSDSVTCVLAVAGENVHRPGLVDAVRAVANQALLALESADLTEQVLQRKSEAHFRSLIQNTSDIILVVDDGLDVAYHTPSLRLLLGGDQADVVGLPVLGLLSGEHTSRMEVLLRRARTLGRRDQATAREPDDEWHLLDREGWPRAFEVTCNNLLDDPSVRGLVLTLHDTTERLALEKQLKHLAFHDSLTELPNRALLLDRVEHALSRQGRHRELLAVMLIDLDDFKMVNDTRGHAAGDALLSLVGQRLNAVLRPEDTCARLGGDEFAVLVEGLFDAHEAGQLAERIVGELRRPFQIGADEVNVGASLGLTTSEHGDDAAGLLMQADLAMYAAKDAGKGTYEFFRPSLALDMQSRSNQRQDLQRALEDNQFELHYQPIVDLRRGTVVGAEALVRWRHPTRGLVMPAEFIDVVEDGDLVLPLGQWVMETAIGQAAMWQRLAGTARPLRMTVNVAPRQLRDTGFVELVAAALALHSLDPHALTIEITERTLVVQDPQIVLTMQRLESLGVGLAVDDFGTGYAALGYLRRFPVTTLKIDRSFVSGVDRAGDDHALVEAIIRLAETFGLGVVAEGVETSAQRDALLALGCEQGQGFLFASALQPVDFTPLLLDSSDDRARFAVPALNLTTDGRRTP
jgi:diguanylate cyclase (GGDEF)-like protein/PAS domain S-box-containing protein